MGSGAQLCVPDPLTGLPDVAVTVEQWVTAPAILSPTTNQRASCYSRMQSEEVLK